MTLDCGFRVESDNRLSVYEDEATKQNLDIFTAASVGDVDIMKLLINDQKSAYLHHGVENIDAQNKGGWTALMYAAYVGREKACRFLIECRANLEVKNFSGQTALMLAASCGNENVCVLLLQSGANIKASDSQGWNCLVYAANCNHTHLVKLLLQKGASPNQV